MPTTNTTNFTELLILDYPSTSNIITPLKEEVLAHKQEKSKLNIELYVMHYDTSDIWDKTTIEIYEPFICMIGENLSSKKDNP